MAKGIKVCKVCGRQYEACHSQKVNMDSVFRWQDVACSPECGAEYLRRVMIARGELVQEADVEKTEPEAQETTQKKTRRKKAAEESPADA